ncbi:hypothetical protein [Pedobacter nototheniae]|uniref:hypothetical protein n=1 Tax=Pedobacter nototheniae TaxID=2488994 RepID=UPI00292DEDC8|nr:hypothetical protein [Pedobacter nototheniae]
MKTPLFRLILFGLILTLSSCYTIYQLSPAKNNFNYKNNLEYEVYGMSSASQQATGNSRIVAKKGYTFVSVRLKVSNKTNENVALDFSEVSLLDVVNMVKYPVSFVYQATVVALPAKNKTTLGPQKSLKRIVLITFPDKMKPEILEISGERYEIQFSK